MAWAWKHSKKGERMLVASAQQDSSQPLQLILVQHSNELTSWQMSIRLSLVSFFLKKSFITRSNIFSLIPSWMFVAYRSKLTNIACGDDRQSPWNTPADGIIVQMLYAIAYYLTWTNTGPQPVIDMFVNWRGLPLKCIAIPSVILDAGISGKSNWRILLWEG